MSNVRTLASLTSNSSGISLATASSTDLSRMDEYLELVKKFSKLSDTEKLAIGLQYPQFPACFFSLKEALNSGKQDNDDNDEENKKKKKKEGVTGSKSTLEFFAKYTDAKARADAAYVHEALKVVEEIDGAAIPIVEGEDLDAMAHGNAHVENLF